MQESTRVSAIFRILATAWVVAMTPLFMVDATMAFSGEEMTGSEGQNASSESSADAPEHEWLTDDNGKKYRLEELEKGVEGRDWRWAEEDQKIKIRYGIVLDIVSHDDDKFIYKVYHRPKPKVMTPEERQQVLDDKKRAEEELRAEIAETYRTDLETVDRLSFGAFSRGLPSRGQWRNGFDVADMNADGHLDIVFGAPRKAYPARPHIYLGDSAGNWQIWREARFPSLPFDYGDAAVDDFNGDGHMDLALGIHLKGILVMVGNGEGRFTPWSRGIGFEIPGKGGDGSTFSSRAIETADWNGDGRPDLLALGEGPKGIARVIAGEDELKTANGPIFFLNQGDGSWRTSGLPSKVFGESLAMGDFNGDGRLDFVTGSNSPNHTILNLGQGGEDWEPLWFKDARPRAYLRSVASGKLNDDDVDDLVVGYLSNEGGVWRSGVDVFFASKELEWERRTLYTAEDKRGIYGLATGDLDGDRQTDIVVTTGDREVLVFLGEEDGFFAREDTPELPQEAPGCRGYALRMVDLDNDQRDDLIIGFAGEKIGGVGFSDKDGCENGGSLRAWKSLDPASVTETAGEVAAP